MMKLHKKETCPECGSYDLEFKAWVDKNKTQPKKRVKNYYK